MFKAVTEPPASFNPLKFSSMKMLISSIAFYIIPPTDPLIPFILSLWVYFILNYYITGVSEMNFRQILDKFLGYCSVFGVQLTLDF